MANRNYPSQRVFGWAGMPVRIQGKMPVGATGAVGTIAGTGIKAITRLVAGVYQIQLDDNYASFLGLDWQFRAPLTGSSVPAGSLSVGTVYEITALGTSTQANWVTAGVPSGITAQVGTVFKAAATTSGTGTAKALGASGIVAVEILGDPQDMLSNQPFVQGSGGAYITIKCLAATDASTTTLVATDPADGSTLIFDIWMNNSAALPGQ